MRPRLCMLLLGLLLLSDRGTIQTPSSYEENLTEEKHWPELVIPKSLSFSCNPTELGFNTSSPSVNFLRPSHIKFVDSIGIHEIVPAFHTVSVTEKPHRLEEMTQDMCLGVGADIIKSFNPTVLKTVCTPRREVTPHSGAGDLWTQATELVRSMKENPKLDFENDWKLINVFISNEKECSLCPVAAQQRFVTSVMDKMAKTLDYLFKEVPRAFVNLVDLTYVMEFSTLPKMGTQGRHNVKSCRCSEEMAPSKDVARWFYQETWESVLASSKYNQKNYFALVFQPFFYKTAWSPFLEKRLLQDPTSLGVHLWNIMMDPAGQKDSPYDAEDIRVVKCPPKESPYLSTYRNSNYQFRLPRSYAVFKSKQVLFDCPDRTPSKAVPLSVHKLKPADIKVVAAVGDSLMVAHGDSSRSENDNNVLIEHEGLSWRNISDKMWEDFITLPNILQKFNHKLKSYSVGQERKYGAGASLNQPVTGARSRDMPNQVQEVIRWMKNDKNIQYKEDWKLLTMFLRGSDLCHFCTEEPHLTPEGFRHNIQTALDILHAKVPRMIVNMVLLPEIIRLRELYKEHSANCSSSLRKMCPCIVRSTENSQEHTQAFLYNRMYQKLVRDMVESGRYDTKDDFTVVLQPFFERLEMPRTKEGLPDLTYFAPDCFHFSQKTLARAVSALWNNMLQPEVGQKSRQHDFTSDIVLDCPTQAQPFLRTSKLSAKKYGSFLNCRDFSPSSKSPDTVHSLKPGDIKVVASLGDAVPAGTGIDATPKAYQTFLQEYRGKSFSSGGQGNLLDTTTLPNILRMFNKHLKGFSTGTGKAENEEAALNLATTGAKTKDLLNQAKMLVQRMKTRPDIDFENDWKVITVMIGYYDLCSFCEDLNLYSANAFSENIRDALDYLHVEMPRALVNLLFFMDPLAHWHLFLKNTEDCPLERTRFCDCLLFPKILCNSEFTLENMARTYKNNLRNLVASGRYDSKTDFTVVLQPFLNKLHIPVWPNNTLDSSFFTPDCLHPSQKFHTQLARALWNNMIQPVGQKTETLDLEIPENLTCPDENEKAPYLKTAKNSDYEYPEPIKEQEWGSDFTCLRLSSTNSPTSAHELKPTDIKVVAAMGDWITTGVGASPDKRDQDATWRGLSWSIGGDMDINTHTTLPNILCKYNLQILGFSSGSWNELSALNVADASHRAQDLPEQARNLIELMKNTEGINFDTDWKLITILTGINDLCSMCANNENDSDLSNSYAKFIEDALDIFFKELPRVYINLVEIMQVTSLYGKQGGICAQKPLNACPCFKGSENKLKMEELITVTKDFQVHWLLMDEHTQSIPLPVAAMKAVSKLSFKELYQDRKDFVVVAQPVFRNSVFPLNSNGEIDSSYFSEDCFHFSARGHDVMARELWNIMLEPVDSKTLANDIKKDRKLKCPSSTHPYFYTIMNSKISAKINWLLLSLVGLFALLLLLLLLLVCLACKKHDRKAALKEPEEELGGEEEAEAEEEAEEEEAEEAEAEEAEEEEEV